MIRARRTIVARSPARIKACSASEMGPLARELQRDLLAARPADEPAGLTVGETAELAAEAIHMWLQAALAMPGRFNDDEVVDEAYNRLMLCRDCWQDEGFHKPDDCPKVTNSDAGPRVAFT